MGLQSGDVEKVNIPYLEEILLADEELSETDKLRLKECYRMIKDYERPEELQARLRGLLALYANKDAKIMLAGIRESGSHPDVNLNFFDEVVNLGEFIKMMVARIMKQPSSKAKNPPHFRGVRKGEEKKEEQSQFSIDEEELSVLRFNFAARGKKRSSNNDKPATNSRIVNYSNNKRNMQSPAIIPTLLHAVKNGGYSLSSRSFNLKKQHYQYPVYMQEEDFNIMLVLDSSHSTNWVIPHIEKFVKLITQNVSQARDKLGLITFNNDTAQIFHYPTLNVKQVIGTINELEVSGLTPLADGLNLAKQTMEREQYNVAGTKNIILLISDCFPEPVKGGFEDLLDEPCYVEAFKAAETISDSKTSLMIINPAVEEGKSKNWGQKLAEKIEAETNTKYLELHPKNMFKVFGTGDTVLDEDELHRFIESINEMRME